MCMTAGLWEDLPDEEVCWRHLQPRHADHHRGWLHCQDAGGERKYSEASDLVRVNRIWFNITYNIFILHIGPVTGLQSKLIECPMWKVDQITSDLNTYQSRDTAGQERFAPIGSMYYHGAKAVIFTYDITQVAIVILLWFKGFMFTHHPEKDLWQSSPVEAKVWGEERRLRKFTLL